MEFNKIKKIDFILNRTNYLVYNNDIFIYSMNRECRIARIYKTELLTEEKLSIEHKAGFKDVKNYYFNNINEKYIQISKEYLAKSIELGNNTIALLRKVNSDEIESFYFLEIWLQVKGIKLKPGQFGTILDKYPNDFIVTWLYPKDIHLSREKIIDPQEPRSVAYLVPFSDIDRIIGVKRFRDPKWIGTENEKDFTGESEEIILDIRNFDEKTYEFFLQHDAFKIEW
jgi:hypothetical protein